MSRIGKQPITLPQGVTIILDGNLVEVNGPKGTLQRRVPDILDLELNAGVLLVKRRNEEWVSKSLHGLTRALVANMVTGVSKGFTRELEIQGRGYRATVDGKTLVMDLGYSHQVKFPAPEGITITTPSNTSIVVSGADKEQVGQVAAIIRGYRKPEPYQGKGIRYVGEYVARKAGKKNV